MVASLYDCLVITRLSMLSAWLSHILCRWPPHYIILSVDAAWLSHVCRWLPGYHVFSVFQYDAEVAVLRQQLQDSQSRLQEAESRLHIHESDTQEIIVEWQKRLEESEERMRQQQVEKDDQMKGIMQR